MCKAPDVIRRSDTLLYPTCGRVGWCDLQGTAQLNWLDTNHLPFLVDAHTQHSTLLCTFLHFPCTLPAYLLQIHDPARYKWAPNSAHTPEMCFFCFLFFFQVGKGIYTVDRGSARVLEHSPASDDTTSTLSCRKTALRSQWTLQGGCEGYNVAPSHPSQSKGAEAKECAV